MSEDITFEELRQTIEKFGICICPVCGEELESLEMLDSHFQAMHGKIIESMIELSNEPETRKTIDSYIEQRKKEILEKAYSEEPKFFSDCQRDSSILEKRVLDTIWKESLSKARRVSTLDSMFSKLTFPDTEGKCQEGYVEVQDEEGTKRCVPHEEYEKYKERYPDKYINPEYAKPETQEKDSEELSENDRHRKELILILTSLMRKQKKEEVHKE